MIAKEVAFENLDGEKVTRKFWFNLNKAELAKMQVRHQNFQSYIQAAIDSDNMERVIGVFDELLSLSYGVRDEDGISFHKSEALWDAFKNSDAYSELFVDLLGNPEKAGEFFAGLVPRDFQDGIKTAMKKAQAEIVDVNNNLFSQVGDAQAEETGPPTHEVKLPTVEEMPLLATPVNRGVSMQDRLAGMSEEEKAALRAALD